MSGGDSGSELPAHIAVGNKSSVARSPKRGTVAAYSRIDSRRSCGKGFVTNGAPVNDASKVVPRQTSSHIHVATTKRTTVLSVGAKAGGNGEALGPRSRPRPRALSASEKTPARPLPVFKDCAFSGGEDTVKPRRRYTVGVMAHCGSIYEELTRQLIATGRWSSVTVKQRTGLKALYIDETGQDISNANVHLLLGDKPSCERVISTRRALWKRRQHGPVVSTGSFTMGPRMPMGSGDDGEPRVVDFVENTRCITLKSMMVTTLLRYHHYDWGVLGSYLPMTFKITPGKPLDDERMQLVRMSRRYLPGDAPMWIAKSSSGCHGDDIEIFPGDSSGVQRLLSYVDSHRDVWVAQQYIDRPLLYHKRKFDLRVMALYIRDTDEVYVHEDFVMRMSSVPYDRASATCNSQESKLAHITNHCIQETGNTYSAFEEGNELWKEHLDGLIRYKANHLTAVRRRELLKPISSDERGTLSASGFPGLGNSPYSIDLNASRNKSRLSGGVSSSIPKASSSGITLQNTIMPQIHRIIVDSICAAKPYLPLEPQPPPTHCFQVLGYDFLLDESLKVWLLEINGAPGGPMRLVPKIMADTIELCINPFFPCTLDSRPSVNNGYRRVYPE